MVDLAVIIVTWNARQLVENALQSLLVDVHANGPVTSVYVVDCASSDGTAETIEAGFPTVNLIKSEKNLGFAAGNNLALKMIGFGSPVSDNLPKAVYLLNPDTITTPGATRILFDALMAGSRVGLVGARLSFANGSFQHSAFHFPGLRQLWVEFFPTPGRLIEGQFNGRYPRSRYEAGKAFAVDCVLGATMMLRREVIQQTGMFDEQFFMYCEEIDWAWRIHHAGWYVKCVPSAHVVHLGGQSTSMVRPQSIVNLWTSRLRLFQKHYSPLKYFLAKQIMIMGMRRKIRKLSREIIDGRDPLLSAYQSAYQIALHSR
jgi:hypothetical protein